MRRMALLNMICGRLLWVASGRPLHYAVMLLRVDALYRLNVRLGLVSPIRDLE